MHLLELNELIEAGENEFTEFKRKFSSEDKIAKEMIAFANSKGGKILFGINDDGSVYGVESEKGEIELIDLAARFYCEPEIFYKTDILQIYKRDVVVVTIPESNTKPHRLLSDGKPAKDEKVYIRFKDKSVLASQETVKVLKNSCVNSKPMIFELGDKEKFLISYLEAHERLTHEELKKLLNISNRRASRMLVNMVRAGLIRLHNTETRDFYTLI